MTDFTIETRAGIPVVVWSDGSCHPANAVEIEQDAEIARIRAEVERLKASDRAIFNALNGKVCDPDPLKPLWYGPALITPTTYSLFENGTSPLI